MFALGEKVGGAGKCAGIGGEVLNYQGNELLDEVLPEGPCEVTDVDVDGFEVQRLLPESEMRYGVKDILLGIL